MIETKHTPGPISYYKCACGHRACTQYTLSTQGGVGFDEADARLYAAAPELLAALEETLAKWVDMANSGDCGFWDPEEEQHVIAARAAIAKATGAA